MKLDAKALGIAIAIAWGASIFILTLVSVQTGYADSFLLVIKSKCPGYSISWAGSVVGLLYSLIDGFIAGFVIAWLYNKFAK